MIFANLFFKGFCHSKDDEEDGKNNSNEDGEGEEIVEGTGQF